MRLSGKDNLRHNLERQRRAVPARTRMGVRRGQLLIRRRAVQRTPIDTGNLRSSVTTPATTTEGHIVNATIGYTAAYAPYVHENLEANFNAPGTGPKFLESALRESGPDVLDLIRRSTQL